MSREKTAWLACSELTFSKTSSYLHRELHWDWFSGRGAAEGVFFSDNFPECFIPCCTRLRDTATFFKHAERNKSSSIVSKRLTYLDQHPALGTVIDLLMSVLIYRHWWENWICSTCWFCLLEIGKRHLSYSSNLFLFECTCFGGGGTRMIHKNTDYAPACFTIKQKNKIFGEKERRATFCRAAT